MNEALLNYICRRRLDRDYIEKKCQITNNCIKVPLYTFVGQRGWQERYITPVNWIKSKTAYGSTWTYFLTRRNKEKDVILIVEGEIDFLSILPYAKDYNLIGLKWINNLRRCIREIEGLNKVYDVYLLVDNDIPADESIARIPYTPIHLYDVREALWWCKDVNDAICQWKLNMSVLPKRIVKLKPQPKKKFTHMDTLDTIEKIDSLPVVEVLERLFPEYKCKSNYAIDDNWKQTDGYKYSKSLNIVTDFSWKGRPEGGPYQIAKKKFWEAKLVFEYFKGLIK